MVYIIEKKYDVECLFGKYLMSVKEFDLYINRYFWRYFRKKKIYFSCILCLIVFKVFKDYRSLIVYKCICWVFLYMYLKLKLK